MSVTKTNRIIFDGKLKAARDYWVDRLSREAATSGLPPDSVESPRESGARSVVTLPLTEALSRKLVYSSGGSHISLYATLLAALNVCLYRHAGRSRLVVASPSLRAEREAAGHPPNVLPVITDVDGAQTFNELVADVGETLKEAYENQGYPFGRMLRDLGLDESGGGRALSEVSLRLRNIHDDLPGVGDGVSFVFDASADGLAGEVEYDARRFPHDTIVRLASHFVNLLDAATDRLNAPVRELEFLNDDERRQLITGWNETATDFPAHECLHGLFEAQAARSPDAVALVFADQHVTYRELNARADRLARRLSALGVGPEAVVAIHTGRGPEMIVGLLATLKAGGAYMPLDPDYPAQRLSFMLEDGRPVVVLTRRSLLDSLPGCDAPVVCMDAHAPQADAPPGARFAPAATPDNLAYVIYTSGSTGRPKGVMIEHHSAVNLTCAQIEAFSIRADSRVLQFASFSFDASVSEIFTALCSGATLHLGAHATLHKGGDIIKTLREEAITTVTLPPALLAVSTGGDRLPSLETLVVAGEECPADLPARWSGGRRFINAYGPTEAGVCATLYEHRETNRLRVPIGGPIANVRVYVLNDDRQLVPVGVEGELYVGGDGVGRGYLGRPSLTAQRFIPDPFSQRPGSRLYRTGDVVRRLACGSLEYVGRGDGQVKVRGHRVELGEVEAALLCAAGVRAAAVVAREGAGGSASLVAYVVAGEGWEGEEAVKGEAARRLPEYMRPGEVVLLDEMPLTENGKVDKSRLPEVSAGAGVGRGGGECGTEAERAVAKVWEEVLGVEGVGGADNFFELGGHSLLATQVMTRVREELGVDLPVYDLFENPTVEDFAAHIEAVRNGLHDAAHSPDSWGDMEEGEL